MTVRPSTLLLTFNSIHDALRAERLLKEKGVSCELVPTPRSLSSDCGMSLEVCACSLPALQSLHSEGLLEYKSLFSEAR